MRKIKKALSLLLVGMIAVTSMFCGAITSEAASKLSEPSVFYANSYSNYINLSWTAVSGADAYRVYKYNSSSKLFGTYKTVSTTSCKVTNLKADTKYQFKVAALVKKNGKYSVQTSTDTLVTRTTKSAKSRTGEAVFLVGGISTSKAFNQTGMKNLYRIDGITSDDSAINYYFSYCGNSNFGGIGCNEELCFNKKNNKLFRQFFTIYKEQYNTNNLVNRILTTFQSEYGSPRMIEKSGVMWYEWYIDGEYFYLINGEEAVQIVRQFSDYDPLI